MGCVTNKVLCTKCGFPIQSCMCNTYYTTYLPAPSSARITVDKINTTKGIQWNEYVPARPPESGEYLAVIQDIRTGDKTVVNAVFTKESMNWTGFNSNKAFITHFVKIELP